MRAVAWKLRFWPEVIGYRIRRLFIPPAEDRCIMGGNVDPAVWCPRQAVDLFCKKHRSPGWWNEGSGE